MKILASHNDSIVNYLVFDEFFWWHKITKKNQCGGSNVLGTQNAQTLFL
jgi:hypothetical protein